MFNLVPEKTRGAGDIKRTGLALGSAKALSIAASASAHPSLTLVITNDSDEAARITAELEFFLQGKLPVYTLPDWETLPYDVFSPHQDIISERIAALYALPSLTQGVLVVPVSTLMHRLTPKSFIVDQGLKLRVNDTLDIDAFKRQVVDTGYQVVDSVYSHGETAIRGSIIDIFPMGSPLPFRIELFDDDVESIRTFDADTQRSNEKVDSIDLLTAREFPFDATAISAFKRRWRASFDHDHNECPIYQDISSGIAPAGIEYYLPLFFEQVDSLFAYLPEATQICTFSGLENAAEQFWDDVSERYEQRRHDRIKPILSPQALFLDQIQLFSELKCYGRQIFTADEQQEKAGRINLPCELAPNLDADTRSAAPLQALTLAVNSFSGRTLICAESTGRRESLFEQLSAHNLKPYQVESWNEFVESDAAFCITVAPLERALYIPNHLHLVTETQLFGRQVFQRRRRQRQKDGADQVIKNLTELRVGAPVVHLDHGVGRYLGLETIELDGQSNEFLTLEYANDAKLYVPVSSLDLIARYSGANDETAPLHRLGTETWSKAKKKAAEKASDAAAELLDIYARRAAKKGFSFNQPDDDYQSFAAGFPFEETPDQAAAIAAVIRDMIAPTPMDRLVCGDVGFGKTEVAMRAAFTACHSGKQVAVLVPTTLLAQQHYQNFCDRFADWPVNIELISRFRTGKQQSAILSKLESGEVDIVVGTHKLIQKDIKFGNLGLLIIDEEHRFGVQQKERLKSLRAHVDILTLTATPIPRTLNMAMSGIRDLSIIATPPAKRLSVKTFVTEHDDNAVKEAVLRELLRGGQVYYLHNEVKSIEAAAARITELVPEARVAIGHGQMNERELESVMSDFYHKRFNVLVCTTIIETGIDIPNANTIIIHRADKFGLAQLHQLRGRVGRSHHQAYAYMLTPHPKSITKDAGKRLEAIEAARDLGAGFTLATHDLEIRGAGELLGEEQSGQMQTVGFSLFMEMLEEAVESIKAGKTPNLDKPLHQGPEVNLHLPALLPHDYLPDIHMRLITYKRISGAKDDEALRNIEVEMTDRFGLLPPQAKNLMAVTRIKNRAKALNIFKIDIGEDGGRLTFGDFEKIDFMAAMTLVQKQAQTYKMEPNERLRIVKKSKPDHTRIDLVDSLLKTLAGK